MANRATVGNYEYCAVTKETTHGVAVQPTNFVKNTSIGVGNNPTYMNIEQIDNTFFQGATLKDKISTGGDFSAYANSTDAGYLLSMAFGLPSTTLVTTGVYEHTFDLEANPVQTFTVETSKGDYVERIAGVAMNTISVKNDGAAIKIDGTAMGEKSFLYATLLNNETLGTGVKFELDTVDNLLVGDVLVFSSDLEEVTLTAVDSTLKTVSANLVSNKTAGDVVKLKRKTATFTSGEPLKFYGKAEVKFADTFGALGAATGTVVREISVNGNNNLQEDFGSGSYNPQDIIQGLRNGEGKITLTMAQGSALQYKFNKDTYQYITFKAEGEKIGATSHYESLTFTAKVKFTSSPVTVASGQIIILNMTFKIVDEANFKLKNAVASY